MPTSAVLLRPTACVGSLIYKLVSTAISPNLHAAKLHIISGLAYPPGLTTSARLKLSWHLHLLFRESRSPLLYDISKAILRVGYLICHSVRFLFPKQATGMYIHSAPTAVEA